jgi:hypothetical protein
MPAKIFTGIFEKCQQFHMPALFNVHVNIFAGTFPEMPAIVFNDCSKCSTFFCALKTFFWHF